MLLTLELTPELESFLKDSAESVECNVPDYVIRLIEAHPSLPKGRAKTRELAIQLGTVVALLTLLVFIFGKPEIPWLLGLGSGAMVGFFVAAMVEGVRNR